MKLLSEDEIIEATRRIDFEAVKARLKATDELVERHKPSAKAMRLVVDR